MAKKLVQILGVYGLQQWMRKWLMMYILRSTFKCSTTEGYLPKRWGNFQAASARNQKHAETPGRGKWTSCPTARYRKTDTKKLIEFSSVGSFNSQGRRCFAGWNYERLCEKNTLRRIWEYRFETETKKHSSAHFSHFQTNTKMEMGSNWTGHAQTNRASSEILKR